VILLGQWLIMGRWGRVTAYCVGEEITAEAAHSTRMAGAISRPDAGGCTMLRSTRPRGRRCCTCAAPPTRGWGPIKLTAGRSADACCGCCMIQSGALTHAAQAALVGARGSGQSLPLFPTHRRPICRSGADYGMRSS